MRGKAGWLLVGCAAALLSGCGAPTATVSGDVTVNGHPLESGIISYAPADGQAPQATAAVQNGKYRLKTVPGKAWVQISAPVVTGKRKEYNGPDAPMVDVSEESLPERYNAKTELTVDLKSGDNTKDWSVESKQHAAGR